jgi:hypothetical protein
MYTRDLGKRKKSLKNEKRRLMEKVLLKLEKNKKEEK